MVQSDRTNENSEATRHDIHTYDGDVFACFRRVGEVIATILVFGVFIWLLLAVLVWLFALFLPGDLSTAVKLPILFAVVFIAVLLLFKSYELIGGGSLEKLANSFSRWFREYDWSCHGAHPEPSPCSKYMRPAGHGSTPTLLSIALIFVLISGGRVLNLGVVPYALFLLGVVGILLVNRWWPSTRWDFLPHLAVITLVSIVVFAHPAADIDGGRVIEAGLYRHTWIPVYWGIVALLVLSAMLSRQLFRKYKHLFAHLQANYATAGNTESNAVQSVQQEAMHPKSIIFEVGSGNDKNGIDFWRFARSLVKVPVFRLLEIAFWPSLIVVGIADWELMGKLALTFGVTAWVVYALGDMHEGLDDYLLGWRRLLFRGIPAIVSLVVIALAAGRLFDNSYIRTVIEGGEPIFGFTTNPVLLFYLFSAYVLAGFLGYWTNRLITRHLIEMFDGNNSANGAGGSVNILYAQGGQVSEGLLQILDADRYVLLDRSHPTLEQNGVKRILGRTQLLAETIADSDQVQLGDRAASRYAQTLSGRVFKRALHHRIRFYFTTILLVFGIGFFVISFWLRSLPQQAQLTVQALPAGEHADLFDLRKHLFDGKRWTHRSPILLAASGGGTRAALYTYSVMGGLHDVGLLKDVVLASGVSGGSAAIAYLAMHRELLIDNPRLIEQMDVPVSNTDDSEAPMDPWKQFEDVMSAPFIQDAFAGLSEWRMASGCRSDKALEGLRLGVQLQESFDRRFALEQGNHGIVYKKACQSETDSESANDQILRLGQQTKLGLIFNTTLAGIIECDEPQSCGGVVLKDDQHIDDIGDGYTTTLGKGGRLILTNLRVERSGNNSEGQFPDGADSLPATPDDYLTYRVLNAPDVPIVSAAALSANFPPVFPNAAVDVEKPAKKRYWITDGGANDNRGILSLLYALEGAVEEELRNVRASLPKLPEQQQSVHCPNQRSGSYPAVHIVIAEASATDRLYQQDRGITARFGGAERFASQLMVDKLKKIARDYECLGGQGIYLHNLQMPLTLRSAGGIGTHWMLPRNLTLREPFGFVSKHERQQDGLTDLSSLFRLTEPGVDVSGLQARKLVDGLHRIPWSEAASFGDCAKPDNEDAKCAQLKQVWDEWICSDPQNPSHGDSWRTLLSQLAEEKFIAAAGCNSDGVGREAASTRVSGE